MYFMLVMFLYDCVLLSSLMSVSMTLVYVYRLHNAAH